MSIALHIRRLQEQAAGCEVEPPLSTRIENLARRDRFKQEQENLERFHRENAEKAHRVAAAKPVENYLQKLLNNFK